MICDRIANAGWYEKISPGLARAFAALRDGSLTGAAPGRHEIDGDRVFALVQSYTTRPPEQCNFESHRRYIDVQAVLQGEEAMGHAPAGQLSVSRPYDEESDYALYSRYEKMSWLRLRAGDFAVFFPEDAHMPCAQSDGPAEVRKVVVKVRVEPVG